MLRRYRIYTGPTIVQETAMRLDAAGFHVVTVGTEHVYIETTRDKEQVLKVLGLTWIWNDVLEIGGHT